MTNRAYYSENVRDFIREDNSFVLGKIVENYPFDLTDLQKTAWIEEIEILQNQLSSLECGRILFEYVIPRMGKRVDVVLLYKGLIFLFEFKVGDKEYRKTTSDQVLDYALDLKNFQLGSRDKTILPVSVPTEAASNNVDANLEKYSDDIVKPVGVNKNSISYVIELAGRKYGGPEMDYVVWEESKYMPTPTIVEAAQALYNNHSVEEIHNHDAENLTSTLDCIKEIVSRSKLQKEKAIVFVTGVPGAGKTLVGLTLASEYHNDNEKEHAVFLSGNLPLVQVLQEALARDKVKREQEKGVRVKKDDALRQVKSFIQIIHHYRDEYVGNHRVPTEHIAIFDESQRAWTREQISNFMLKKKGIRDFEYSEPEFLISTMDRLDDWGVIVCLVGGGQEINSGEAGMPEWFYSLQRSFSDWKVYTAENIKTSEYLRDQTWEALIKGLDVKIDKSLYLSTSTRSFRSENVSSMIQCLLDNDYNNTCHYYNLIKENYPIVITRDLNKAKQWVRNHARGSERIGLLASSNAARLKPYGVVYAKDRSSISPTAWYLNPDDDIRSSCFLEVVASEFETQGLELDFAIVAWDADFRIENGVWTAYTFSKQKIPPDWSKVKDDEKKLFMKNAYRVLLTRSRQGFVIFVPEGSQEDKTRKPTNYDLTFDYLKKIGIPEI